jgi:glycosyltransferase involved in cell wall biosynthesis
VRIFCLDHEPSSKRGGQELSLADECEGLARLGHEVTLGYVVEGDLLSRYRAAGIRTLQLPTTGVGAGALRLVAVPRLVRSVIRAARTRPDIVCVNQYHDTPFGSAVARLCRVPLVSHLRLFPPDRFCGQWRIGLGAVTRFIAVSHAVREAWVERGVDAAIVDVVHDGIDTQRFRPAADRLAIRRSLGVPDEAFVVAFAGRLDRQKHPEALLDTFAALGLPASRARLLVAGRPVDHPSPEAGAAYVEELKGRAESLGIGPAVHWLGSRPDVPDLMGAADATALFTLYPDALPRAIYESLACGTPAVAQRDGGTPEVLTGEFAAHAFDAHVPGDALRVLRSMIGWRDRDPGLAGRARAHAVAGFSKDAMVEGVARALERARASRRRRLGPTWSSLAGVRLVRPLTLAGADRTDLTPASRS